jgi:hypothetical protein
VFRVVLVALLMHLSTFGILMYYYRNMKKDYKILRAWNSLCLSLLICESESESAELISSVFKENVSELELEIINLQTDLSLKQQWMTQTSWISCCLQSSILKQVSLKVNACFSSAYLSESGFSTMKVLKSKYRSSLNDKHINECMNVAVTK